MKTKDNAAESLVLLVLTVALVCAAAVLAVLSGGCSEDPEPMSIAPDARVDATPLDGGSGGLPTGSACVSAQECAGGDCLLEWASMTFPMGYCSGPCPAGHIDCEGWNGSFHGDSEVCLLGNDGSKQCGDPCDVETDCREGYSCRVLSITPWASVCLPDAP